MTTCRMMASLLSSRATSETMSLTGIGSTSGVVAPNDPSRLPHHVRRARGGVEDVARDRFELFVAGAIPRERRLIVDAAVMITVNG